MKTINIKIKGIAPLSQSRKYTEKVSTSKAAAYDEANWRKKMHVDEEGFVVLPATGVKQSIEAAAKLAGEKVIGSRRGWAGVFLSGIMVAENWRTNVEAATVKSQTFSCDIKGMRGDASSARVDRTFPMIDPGWEAEGQITILNDEIEPERLKTYLEKAGLIVGLGRFRPSKGGHNGRFRVEHFEVVEEF